MKNPIILLIIALSLCAATLQGQNAPITKAGAITNAVAGSSVTVPVTATGFVNIRSLSLTLDYTVASIQYLSVVPNPALAANFSLTYSNVTGRITMSWFGSPVTFPDGTHLVDLTFNYSGGTSALTWFDNGGSCQYTDGSYTVLNDTPTSTYYIYGVITSQAAPVTIAPVITNAAPGSVNVPVTVNGFTAIRSISLTLEYNKNVLTYVDFTPDAALSSGTMTVTPYDPGTGKMQLTISWAGNPSTIVTGGTLLTLRFNFTTSNGFSFSELTWIDNGGSCQYSGSSYNILYDSPTADYYKNGLVALKAAPITYLPTITTAVPGNQVTVPVTVDNFTSDLKSFSLKFDYDGTKMSYVTFSQNPALVGSVVVGDQALTGGKRRLAIVWFGTAPTLPNGSYLVNLTFNFTTGFTLLSWYDSGSSCEYGTVNYVPLWDKPQADYYKNGYVTHRTSPVTIADQVATTAGSEVFVPVRVFSFNNIGSISLTLDYDPGVATFVGALPACPLADNFTYINSYSGRIVLSWFGSNLSLPDNTELARLKFIYNSGTTPLTWYDNGGSCQYSDGQTYQVILDTPQSTYYQDGSIAEGGSWTGLTSTDWSTASNWLGGRIPSSTISAVIPASAPNWPTLTGNLTLGGNCKNLVLNGNSEVNVIGNLTINPGYQVNVLAGGTLRVGGNWSNTGVFNCGTGTVEFNGPNPSAIQDGTPSPNDIRNMQLSTFTAGMTNLSGGTPGPSGDNAHSDVSIGFPFYYLGTWYTDLRINTNGWVSLNKSGDDAGSEVNGSLFTAVAPNTVLAPWWDDLTTDGSTAITYQLTGATPNRVFTVEWKGILTYSSDATARLNFQVKLNETSNLIEFHYGTVVAGTHNSGESASIGLDNLTGAYIDATTGSSSGCSARLVSPGSWPSVNYRFTPPPLKETFYKVVGNKSGPTVPQTVTVEKDIRITKP